MQPDPAHLLQGHCTRAAFAAAIDDEKIAPLALALAERIAQSHRIAHPAQRLVGDDHPDIGNIKHLAARSGDPRYIGDNVMELGTQYGDERSNCVGRELSVSAERFLGAQHEQPLAVSDYGALEKDAVDALRIGKCFAQSRCRF